MSKSATDARVEGLELARFVLALMVLVYHYLWYGPATSYVRAQPAWDYLIYGRFGVDAFFVISGYVIAKSCKGRSAWQFVVARAGRLWPALALCAVVTTAIAGGKLTTMAGAVALLPLVFGRGMVDSSYWSIAVELQFYSAIALLLLIWKRLPNLDILAGVWCVMSFLALVVPNPVLQAVTLTPYSAFFIFGLLFCSHEQGSKFARWEILPALALASVQAWVSFERVDLMDGVRAPWWVGVVIASVILVSTFAMRRRLNAVIAPAAITLGASTYSLYLLHQDAGYRVIGWLEPVLGHYAAVAATGMAVLVAAWCISRYFEPFARPRLVAALKRLGTAKVRVAERPS